MKNLEHFFGANFANNVPIYFFNFQGVWQFSNHAESDFYAILCTRIPVLGHFWFLLTSPFLVMESGWGAVRLVEKVSCMAISLLLMDIVPVEAFFACKILIVDNIFSNSAWVKHYRNVIGYIRDRNGVIIKSYRVMDLHWYLSRTYIAGQDLARIRYSIAGNCLSAWWTCWFEISSPALVPQAPCLDPSSQGRTEKKMIFTYLLIRFAQLQCVLCLVLSVWHQSGLLQITELSRPQHFVSAILSHRNIKILQKIFWTLSFLVFSSVE